MAKIGLFYGTTTGKTETVAEAIQQEFGGSEVVALYEISEAEKEDFEAYDCLIIGCPTWNIGELQSDWDGYYNDDLNSLDFSGKKVAYFGTGDQVAYADNFQDAMGILEEKISQLGGKTVGYWPIDGYEFEASRAVRDGQFVGLALDEDDREELTEQRIQDWVFKLRKEFGI